MGRKPKAQTKATSRSRKKTIKPTETPSMLSTLQPDEMEEVMEQESVSDEEKAIVIRGREAVREVLEMVSQMPYPGVGLRTVAGILRGETRANWLSYIARTESWGVFFPANYCWWEQVWSMSGKPPGFSRTKFCCNFWRSDLQLLRNSNRSKVSASSLSRGWGKKSSKSSIPSKATQKTDLGKRNQAPNSEAGMVAISLTWLP